MNKIQSILCVLLIYTLPFSKGHTVTFPILDKNAQQTTDDVPSIIDTHPKSKQSCKNNEQNINEKELNWLDRAHYNVSNAFCNQVLSIDRFFGNTDADFIEDSSYLRIRNQIIWRQLNGYNVKFKPRIRAKVRFSSIEERLNLLISEEDEDTNTLFDSSDLNELDETNDSVTTTIRWFENTEETNATSYDLGARFNNGIDPFIRSRYQYHKFLSSTRFFKYQQTFFWRDSQGFGERSEFYYEIGINDHFFFRSETDMVFSEISDGIDWVKRLTLYQELDNKRAMSYSIAAAGYTRPNVSIETHGIRFQYRRKVYKNWLFAEVEPELNWFQSNERRIAPSILFRLEAFIGNLDFD